jgi:F-type H+-transporting ATPase subunit c
MALPHLCQGIMSAEREPPAPQDRTGTTSSVEIYKGKEERRMRIRVVFLVLAVILLASMPVFAQGATVSNDNGLKNIGLGLGLGLAAGLCGIGQGKATAGATEAMARNPGNTAAIRTALIIGLALIESLALYMFVFALGKGV